MKRNSFIILLISLFILVLPACQEDEWVDWKLKNEQWLENLKSDNSTDSTFHVTSSGLCYKVNNQGWKFNGKPNTSSLIHVNYAGSLIDGSTFDADTAYFYMSGVIEGWKEGISKMNYGGTYTLYIPSSLGYGSSSTNSLIPPNSTLIFKVDLLTY